MVIVAVLLLGALFVAYANGANDNFKGVATLYGNHMIAATATRSSFSSSSGFRIRGL